MRKWRLKEKLTRLESIPFKTGHPDRDIGLGLVQSKRKATIAWEASRMFFDICIQQFVWRFQPIRQEVFQKGYGETISAVRQMDSVGQNESVCSPTQKIFLNP